MEVVHGLNTNCDRYIRLQLLLTGGIPRAEQDHRDLLQLCRQKKIDEAVVLLRAHILHAANAIQELVAQQVS